VGHGDIAARKGCRVSADCVGEAVRWVEYEFELIPNNSKGN